MSLNASFVKTLPSYIKESQQALAILCDLNFLDQKKFIFSMDITSLYIVIPSFNDEGLRALKHSRTPFRRRKKWQDVSKPVARHFNLPNRSEQPMDIYGLSLHLGSSESCKKLEQKFTFQIGTLIPHGINERFSFN